MSETWMGTRVAEQGRSSYLASVLEWLLLSSAHRLTTVLANSRRRILPASDPLRLQYRSDGQKGMSRKCPPRESQGAGQSGETKRPGLDSNQRPTP